MAFCTGYAVEMGLLLDVYAAAVGHRRASRRSTSTCARTATSRSTTSRRWRRRCSRAVTSRLRREGRLLGGDAAGEPELLERPPLAELRALRDLR